MCREAVIFLPLFPANDGSQPIHVETFAVRTPSFWSLKPWWCQPWSILLTGTLGMMIVWLAHQRLHLSLWIALPVSLAILAWWLLFLVLVPTAAQQEGFNSTNQDKPLQ
jgi:hypothetical protein